MSEKDELPETYPFDKVPEKRMAQLVGTTPRALESKRARGIIPEGVWNKIDNRIFYSIRRYEAWQESQWDCPQELNSLVIQSEFDSLGSVGAAKHYPTLKRPRGSKRPQTSVLT